MAHDNLGVHDKDHMKEHLAGTTVDFESLTEDQLRFHYFRVHDVEGDSRLDGLELLQSLLHFHSEAISIYGAQPRVFSDDELSLMVDPVLESDDKNQDGFIDYAEFEAGQISRGF